MKTVTDQQFKTTVTERFGWDDQFASAFDYVDRVGHSDKGRPRSIDVAKRVIELGNDRDAVIATLLSDPGLREQLDINRIETEFGSTIARSKRCVRSARSRSLCSWLSLDLK